MIDDIILKVLSIIILLFSVNKARKYKLHQLIINDKFWLIFTWEACFLLYCFCGINYPIKLNIMVFGYVFIFWLLFFAGKKIANMYLSKKKNNQSKNEIKVTLEKKINFTPLFIFTTISTIIYIVTTLVLNPDMIVGATRNVTNNSTTSLFLLLSSASLIIWLYELLYFIIKKEKMRYYAIPSAILYNIPGIMISGRDALMIFVLSTLIITVYSISYLKSENAFDESIKKKLKRILYSFLIVIFIYLIFISNIRYGNTADSALNMFTWASGAKFPNYLVFIYQKTAGFGKFLLNIIFYYTSQFSKLTLSYSNYSGPYQFGLHQLHYIARMLPDFVGIQTNAVSSTVQQICQSNGIPGMKVLWDTVIGYSIYDFGKIGALIYSFVAGFIVENIVYINKYNKKELNIIALTLICVGMFTTVEISPISDYFYIFPIIWLIIIKTYNKRRKVKRNEK